MLAIFTFRFILNKFVSFLRPLLTPCIIFFLLFSISFGGGCAGGTRGTGGSDNLKISGIFLDKNSRTGIAGAIITLIETGETTQTDIDGLFTITTTLRQEEYRLRVTKEEINADSIIGKVPTEARSIFVELELNSETGLVDVGELIVDDESVSNNSSNVQTTPEPTPDVTPTPISTPEGTPVPTPTPSQTPVEPGTATPTPTPKPTSSPKPTPPPANPEDDTIAPQLISFSTSNLTSTSVEINLSSSKPSRAFISLDPSNQTEESEIFLTDHTFNFSSLTSETTYTVTINLIDESGNESDEVQETFTTPAPLTLRFDPSGNEGEDDSSSFVINGDMGPGAAGLRFISENDLELFSRHYVYTPEGGGDLTVVLYTRFEVSESGIPDSLRLDWSNAGFIEVWYKVGSTFSNNPQEYSDGVRVLRGEFTGGYGHISTDNYFGAISLYYRVIDFNNNYFYSLPPSSGSMTFLVGDNSGSAVSQFVTSPGGTVESINDLDALYGFPDGGMTFR